MDHFLRFAPQRCACRIIEKIAHLIGVFAQVVKFTGSAYTLYSAFPSSGSHGLKLERHTAAGLANKPFAVSMITRLSPTRNCKQATALRIRVQRRSANLRKCRSKIEG